MECVVIARDVQHQQGWQQADDEEANYVPEYEELCDPVQEDACGLGERAHGGRHAGVAEPLRHLAAKMSMALVEETFVIGRPVHHVSVFVGEVFRVVGTTSELRDKAWRLILLAYPMDQDGGVRHGGRISVILAVLEGGCLADGRLPIVRVHGCAGGQSKPAKVLGLGGQIWRQGCFSAYASARG